MKAADLQVSDVVQLTRKSQVYYQVKQAVIFNAATMILELQEVSTKRIVEYVCSPTQKLIYVEPLKWN